MAKRPTLTNLTGQYGAQSLINNNYTEIEEAFDNTLSRDGSTPNQMEADFDLNGNDLLNANNIVTTTITVGGTDLTASVTAAGDSATAAAASAASAATSASEASDSAAAAQLIEDQIPDWQGMWLTATAYETGDLVRESGNTYICVEAHTSGTFSTDLSTSKWELFAAAGTAGAGTGDMLGANNLSDVDDPAASLANIGGQPVDSGLTSISGLTTAADKMIYTTASDVYATTNLTAAGRALLDDADAETQRTTLDLSTIASKTGDEGEIAYHTGTDWARLPKGSALQSLRMNTGATAPEWVTPVGFSPDYDSGWVSGWSATATFVHGLGVTPRYFIWAVKCATATGGFAVGDVTFLNQVADGDGARRSVIWADATSISIKGYQTGNNPDGSLTSFNATNFEARVYAWK